MDPVSQTQASEELAWRGLAVVGWYHSHPTFAPIPSVRDIETQAKFQVFDLEYGLVVNSLCKSDLVCCLFGREGRVYLFTLMYSNNGSNSVRRERERAY